MLGNICHDEWRIAFPAFQLCSGFAKVGFLHVIDIVLISGFEDRLQALLYPRCSLHGEGQGLEGFGQLNDRGDPDLIPIKVGLLELGKPLVGLFDAGILQAAGIKQMLKHRSLGWLGKRLVMLPE